MLAEELPSRLVGAWSQNCTNPAAAQIILQPGGAAIIAEGQRQIYGGIEISHSWMGGARATGDQVWVLASKQAGQPYDFVIASKSDSLVLEEGHPDHGQEVRHLFGSRFDRCPTGNSQVPQGEGPAPEATNVGIAGAAYRTINVLDVPVIEQGGDGQAANCMSSVVSGLQAGGEGFLAVRSGPGTQYRKLEELHNGDVVIVFEYRGSWAGIVYRTSEVRCSSTTTAPVTYERKGWVHTNWLRPLAG